MPRFICTRCTTPPYHWFSCLINDTFRQAKEGRQAAEPVETLPGHWFTKRTNLLQLHVGAANFQSRGYGLTKAVNIDAELPRHLSISEQQDHLPPTFGLQDIYDNVFYFLVNRVLVPTLPLPLTKQGTGNHWQFFPVVNILAEQVTSVRANIYLTTSSLL